MNFLKIVHNGRPLPIQLYSQTKLVILQKIHLQYPLLLVKLAGTSGSIGIISVNVLFIEFFTNDEC